MSGESYRSGERVDGFLLGEHLSKPVRASFWRVSREGSDLPMVMKVPRLGRGDNPTAAVGFEVEQKVLARLSGPHAPRLVAAGDFAGQPYLVMEYLEGASLYERLAFLPLAASEVSWIGALIAEALADIHRQQVLHLDLQPQNILFRRTGECALVNFGLAHHRELPDLLAEAFRRPLGSGTYISPEQVLQVRSDPRSDLFALGVVLYYLITGRLPFGSPTSLPGLRRRLYHDPDPPRAINRSCPEWLQELILRCLEVDPEARYAGAAEVAADLRQPDRIVLTERARRGRKAGRLGQLVRSVRSRLAALRPLPAAAAAPARRGRRVMAAVDLDPGGEQVALALLAAVRRVLAIDQRARLMCVSVRVVIRGGPNPEPGVAGPNLNARRLVELKYWARTLWLPADRITFQILEATDPAQALIEFIEANHVDRLLLGARGHSAIRRFLGSVSSQVVAASPCTVTVVRAQGTDPLSSDAAAAPS